MITRCEYLKLVDRGSCRRYVSLHCYLIVECVDLEVVLRLLGHVYDVVKEAGVFAVCSWVQEHLGVFYFGENPA